MLRNKKNIAMVMVVLVAVIGLVYAGCSKNADMQTTPKEGMCFKNLSSEAIDNFEIDSPLFDIVVIGNNGYIIKNFLNNTICTETTGRNDNFDISDYKYIKVEPKYTKFLYRIKWVVSANLIEFKKHKYKTPYLNKIGILIKMIENGNFYATLEKGLHDVYKHTLQWVNNQDDIDIINGYFELTKWMIDNPDKELYETMGVWQICYCALNKKAIEITDFMVGAWGCKSADYNVGAGECLSICRNNVGTGQCVSRTEGEYKSCADKCAEGGY